MTIYYYNRYSVNSTTKYRESDWIYDGGTEETVDFRGYTNYYFNSSTNRFALSGSEIVRGQNYPANTTLFKVELSGQRLIAFVFPEPIIGWRDYYAARFYKLSSDSTTYTSYSRGSLLESNIIAENGTYPVNGRSGGYWYVRGSIVPPPNTPTNLKVTGEFKGGKPVILSWDAGSRVTNYRVERQDNGGTWVEIKTTTSRNYTDNIPRGTETVRYRVRTYGDLQFSGYVTSSIYDVKNFPEMKIKINGMLKSGVQGWAKIDGELKDISEIKMKINNVIKEG